MRFDTKITFYRKVDIDYNPKTSKHIYKLISWQEWANVTDIGTASQVELLGKIEQGVKTIRLIQQPANWDYLQIKDSSTRYRFNSSINALKGYAMIVGQDNG